MKRIMLFFMFLLIAIQVSACGNAAVTATQALAQPTATGTLPQSDATEAPAVAGNGTQVDITLADNTIDASMTTFQAGVAYTFVIKNEGRHAHNFNINIPVSTAGSLNAALDGALLSVPQEQLGVGATTTVEFTFPDSAAGAQLEFSCLIRRHYEDGMTLAIAVTK